jgi:hypothetical protein
MEITRRTTLGWLGAVAVGAVAAGCRGADAADGADGEGDYNLTDWVSDRGDQYLIGAGASGQSMEFYQAAVDSGAQALEMGVGLTSDNLLVCLGPRRQPATVPLFEEVLKRFGGKVILCVEAMGDQVHTAMMSMIAKYRLETCVLVRYNFRSPRIAEAKAQGLGVIAYYPAPAQLTSESVQTVASQLSPRTDAIIVPNAGPYGYLADDIAEVAVSTGLPIWPSLLHRKADLTHYRALGMAGAITSDVGYLSGRTEPAVADQWSSGRAAPGELTRDPSDDRYAVKWGPDGSIKLGATKVQHFLTLGNLGPITASSYTVEFEASYDELPRDPAANITLAFGHEDDRYYEHRLGLANGYHAILQADGELGLYSHHAGKPAGTKLSTRTTAPPFRGEWVKLRLEVTPTQLTWIRQDQPAQVIATDKSFRGGYLHVGRGSADGVLSLRRLRVTHTG